MRAHENNEGRAFDVEEEEKQRKWFRSELPMMNTLSARSLLAKCDESFAKLDPLIALEELAEAGPGAKGGKTGRRMVGKRRRGLRGRWLA